MKRVAKSCYNCKFEHECWSSRCDKLVERIKNKIDKRMIRKFDRDSSDDEWNRMYCKDHKFKK